MKQKQLNIICVHHSKDLDGLTSGVLLEQYFLKFMGLLPIEYGDLISNMQFVSFDYYNDEDVLMSKLIVNDESTINLLIFIDVTASLEFYETIKQYDNIITMLFDHHVQKDFEILDVYGLPYKDKFDVEIQTNSNHSSLTNKLIYFISDSMCGSKVFFDTLLNTHFSTIWFKPLISMGLFGTDIQWFTEFEKRPDPYNKINFNGYHKGMIAVLKELEDATTVICENYNQLVHITNLYDIWLWENIVKKEKHKIISDDSYSLIDMFTGQDKLVNNYITEAINAYAFNYFAHRMFKFTQNIPVNEISLLLAVMYNIDFATDLDKFTNTSDMRVDADETQQTVIMKEILTGCTNETNINNFINLGRHYYIKDYSEVADFFANNEDTKIIQEFSGNGFNWMIIESKFSNVIRDYIANNYKHIDFIVFDSVKSGDRSKLSLSGRTIRKGSFPVGPMMKDIFNGGGHPDAGGGTIDKALITDIPQMIQAYVNKL